MKTLRLLGILMLMVGLAGCDFGQGEAVTPDNGEEEVAYGAFALEAQDGGFNEDSAEAVEDFFMEPEADELDELEEFTADDEAEAEALEGPEGQNAVRLLLAWGQFPVNWDLQEVTKWDGFIYGQGAKVFVRRALRYEEHDYYAPCQGHQCVMVYSHTVPHHDGLLLTVVPEPGAENPRVIISFAGLYKRVIPVAVIPAVSEVTKVDNLNNKVVLMGAKAAAPCEVGLLHGYWKRMNPKGGIFGGKWLAHDGTPMGKLAGLWGRRNDGTRVLFGLYMSNSGEFKGVLKGTYKPYPEALDKEGGVFKAFWQDADKEIRGVLRGHYTIAPAGGKGAFIGRWAARCGAEEPAICPEAEVAPVCQCSDNGTCVCADCPEDDCVETGACPEAPSTDPTDCTCENDSADSNGFVDCTCS